MGKKVKALIKLMKYSGKQLEGKQILIEEIIGLIETGDIRDLAKAFFLTAYLDRYIEPETAIELLDNYKEMEHFELVMNLLTGSVLDFAEKELENRAKGFRKVDDLLRSLMRDSEEDNEKVQD